MKKLPSPPVDDTAATTATANNPRLYRTSYPHLRDFLGEILDSYNNYDENNGDALLIMPIGIDAALENGLLTNYASPPASLLYISDIRDSSPAVCPMCGSLKTTSLDHLLPKDDYPEFAIYSRNLVPACDCNTKRGTTLKNVGEGVRILHPYYDDCLNQRQLSCKFVASPAFPKVKITIQYVHPAGEMIDSIMFHVQKVVEPSGLLKWLSSRWSSLAGCPDAVIQTLPRRQVDDVAELREYLTDALERYDEGHGTPNNWYSIFVHGLLESDGVATWLLATHNHRYI